MLGSGTRFKIRPPKGKPRYRYLQLIRYWIPSLTLLDKKKAVRECPSHAMHVREFYTSGRQVFTGHKGVSLIVSERGPLFRLPRREINNNDNKQ